MKRIITFILVVISLLSMSIPCFAAESKEAIECPVYAKYHSSNIELYTTIIENGKGTLIVEDGDCFTVYLEEKYDGYKLVVHPITQSDSEAFAWLENCILDNITDFLAYDIYLLNPKKERVELPNETLIQVTTSKKNDNVIGLSCLGTTTIINASLKDGVLTFRSSENATYYCVHKKDTITDTDTDINSPQTGDNSNIQLWIALMITSMVMLIVTTRKYRTIQK